MTINVLVMHSNRQLLNTIVNFLSENSNLEICDFHRASLYITEVQDKLYMLQPDVLVLGDFESPMVVNKQDIYGYSKDASFKLVYVGLSTCVWNKIPTWRPIPSLDYSEATMLYPILQDLRQCVCTY
jgi:hypothetical protein